MKTPWYKQTWFNGLTVLLILILTTGLIFRTQEPLVLLALIKQVKPHFIFISLLSIALYVVLEGVMLHILIGSKEGGHSPKIALKSVMVGQYYSQITPFASGGQPMQLVSMVQDGLSASHATAVLVNKFLYFQIGVTVYAAVLAVFHWPIVWACISASFGMMGIGLLFNFVGLGVMLAMIFKPRTVKRGSVALIALLKKLRLCGRTKESRFKLKAKRRSWILGVDNFAQSIRSMLSDKAIMVKMMALTVVQLTAYFSMVFWIYKAFGFTGHSFVELVTLQAVLYLSISLIPAPGSAGVAEGGFMLFFGTVFSAGTIAGAMLLWRGIIYYLTLIVTGLATLAISASQLRKKKVVLGARVEIESGDEAVA